MERSGLDAHLQVRAPDAACGNCMDACTLHSITCSCHFHIYLRIGCGRTTRLDSRGIDTLVHDVERKSKLFRAEGKGGHANTVPARVNQ